MDLDSLQKLRLDRRLIKRRGWIGKKQLEQELEKLPDVSNKIAEPEPDVEEGESSGPSDAPPAAPDPLLE